MPIYEFQCRSCEYAFELLLMSKEELDEVRCPRCASPDIGKLMSAPNISTGSTSTNANTGSKAGDYVTHQCKSGSCTQFNLPGHAKS